MSSDLPRTGADALVRRLRDHGVRHVFGYPGGQLTPIYDALYREPSIRHVLARHEQAAAFMADGYARSTSRPGVCLAVCGPGVFNAATPLATAFTDSVPVLLISGQIPARGRGLRSGYYHENDQLSACATMTKWSACAEKVEDIVPALDQAFIALTTGRPGPVLLEVPLDALRAEWAAADWPAVLPPAGPQAPHRTDVAEIAKLLRSRPRPIILAGGGVVSAGAGQVLMQVAERLGAPVFHTAMGKSAVPTDHPLAAGLPWWKATSDLTNMGSYFAPLFSQADVLLAVGCRFTQLATGSWSMPLPLPPGKALAQIDVDREEIGRHYPVAAGAVGDARLALQALLDELPARPRAQWARPEPSTEPWRLPGLDIVGALRRVLPRDAIVVADITRLGYILLADFPVYLPRTFLHPAGFVAMGYGLPGALGAKAAHPDQPVVAIMGDGCFQMCGMELATAVQERLPVVSVVVNDGALTLIKSIQQRKYESRFLGVDLQNPDFGTFARAFGVRHWPAHDDAQFEQALREALAAEAPALIEVRLANASSA
jgi:acetolactate synthase-1/2/3 large subunit